MLTVIATCRTDPGATRGVADLRGQHFRRIIETMRAPLLIERECGFAGYIDTVRDGEGSFRLMPAAATDGGAR